jgi:predicted amidohydrolase YtcJ
MPYQAAAPFCVHRCRSVANSLIGLWENILFAKRTGVSLKTKVFGFSLFAAASLLRAQAPDLVLLNGKVITVDERFTLAQAVAIRGDRFVAVGTTQQISALAGPSTRRVDLHGRAVVPGFIDNHMHLLRAAATWTTEVRLDGIYSRKQAVEKLRARIKTAAPGEWVYNIGGWVHHQFTDDPRPFTRDELDALAPDNPVALQESYYQVFLNSRALALLKIEAGKPDPPNFLANSIQREASPDGRGKPTGVVTGDIAATRAVASQMPRVSADRLEAASAVLFKDMNARGLTTFGVPGCDRNMLDILDKWKSEGKLSLRIFCIDGNAAATPQQTDQTIAQIGKMQLFQGDTWIDHIFFGESVYGPLHDPMFAVHSNPSADQLAQWKRIATAVAAAGLPLHVHAELHNTIDAFLDQIEAINKEHPIKGLRWELAHINQIDAAQIERMKKLGMYASVHPWAVLNGGIMRELFGDGVNDMPPFRTLQDSGIVWGLGSDGTAANLSIPFATLTFAVTGKMVGGMKVNSQTISREDALIAHTRRDALMLFQENNLGSIQPGKLADLVVLDRDYLTVPPDQIKDIKPTMTIVGGRIVYEN